MNTALRTILIMLSVTTVCSAALATESETMRCARGIVSIGDTAGEVLGKCGEPAYATQRMEKRGDERGYRYRTFTTVAIDDWTYNFGPNEFMYRLLIENGRVAMIESLEHGY
jgi:uncharacterized protein DUF2845